MPVASKVFIEYKCMKCGKAPPMSHTGMICTYCMGPIRGYGPGVTGTRDNFGIKREFIDDANGQTIDNWKTWEKRGFRDPTETHKDTRVKHKIKRKIKKIKNS